MDIIRMEGGLGNQLFQYALYRQLQFMGRTVKMDVTTEYGREHDRQHMLWTLGASYEVATQEEINELTDGFMDLPSRIRRKLFGRKTKKYEEQSQNFDPLVLEKTPVYLTGYFQSDCYFRDVVEELRQELHFSEHIWDHISTDLKRRLQEYEQQICSLQAVSLHIRRGDYLEHPEIYGVSCTKEYYDTAIQYIKEYCPDAHFFVFTNDVSWVRTWLEEKASDEFTLIEGTTEENGYLDMMLMSKCRHHIMANSSFSWWGAWLNSYKQKIITAPTPWFGDRDCRDIYTKEMIRISPDGEVCR